MTTSQHRAKFSQCRWAAYQDRGTRWNVLRLHCRGFLSLWSKLRVLFSGISIHSSRWSNNQ